MHKKQKLFLKIDVGLASDIGAHEAMLFAFIQFKLRVLRSDKEGFVGIDTQYIADSLGWNIRAVRRYRKKIVDRGLVTIKTGVNQNTKTRYKIN